jgi:hypothetical protein
LFGKVSFSQLALARDVPGTLEQKASLEACSFGQLGIVNSNPLAGIVLGVEQLELVHVHVS